MQEIGRGVVSILAPNPGPWTGQGTNTYIVTAATGSSLIVDPGPDHAAHLDAVRDVAVARGVPVAIVVTHGHPDHDEGAARLRDLLGVPVLAWSREGTASADRELADEATIGVGERRLTALHTPGHRFDHLCLLLEDDRLLFAGDLVAGTGTVVIAPPEGDVADYLASLRRLRDLDLQLILPGHGPVIDAPRGLLDGYIQHREDRERQVLAGLAAGPGTVEQLVASIYAAVDPALHPAAALSTTAHLLKLERDHRVTRVQAANGTELWRLT